MDTDELFDLVRAKHSLRSETDLAKALHIPAPQLLQHRNKRRPIDVDLAWTIAEMLDKSPAEVLAVIFFEAETDPLKRKRWRDRLLAMGVLTNDR
jgi:hypothetical protein